MAFPRSDVRVYGYLAGGCPNCGRHRLELYVDGDETLKGERAVGIACEKCSAQWLLDPASADHHGEHSRSNPLRPSPPDNNPFGEDS